jgi:RNA polymerase sigma-70 factor, ECF subfamily
MDRSSTGMTWGWRSVPMLLRDLKSGPALEAAAGGDVTLDAETPSSAPLDAKSPAVGGDGAGARAPCVPGGAAAASGVRDQRLERWFRDHFDTLWRFVVRLGVPRQHADDVVQEVFITASRRAADVVLGSERRFLMSVAVKLSANQRRRSARQLDRPALAERDVEHAPTGVPDSADLLDRKRLLTLLYAALDELSSEQRAVFVLHELEGFTVPEIAELLALPEGTAASRLGRARQSFAKAAARVRARWVGGGLP